MPKSKLQSQRIDRRRFIALGAAGVGSLALRPAAARELGDPRRSYGERSPFETSARTFGASVTPGTGSSRAPLQDLYGTITPSALHFERHHSGVPKIDPNAHELLLDGLVERPLVFTLETFDDFPPPQACISSYAPVTAAASMKAVPVRPSSGATVYLAIRNGRACH